MELEFQGRDSTFNFCYALLKTAILHHKMAHGPFVLHRTVNPFWRAVLNVGFEVPIIKGLSQQHLMQAAAAWGHERSIMFAQMLLPLQFAFDTTKM